MVLNKNVVKWGFTTLLVLGGVFVLIRLGFWQLDRLESRREFNQHYMTQIASPPINLNGEINFKDLENMEYRKVEVSGYYEFDNEIYLQNQAWENIPGYRVVTPLKIDQTNLFVFIDRGWISLEDLEFIDEINAKYVQQQELKGIIRLSQSENDFGRDINNIEEINPKFFLYVDLELLQQNTELNLLPIYIQNADEQNIVKPFTKLPEIEITEGPHMGYAMQWFFFASLLGFGFPFFIKKQIQNEKLRSRE